MSTHMFFRRNKKNYPWIINNYSITSPLTCIHTKWPVKTTNGKSELQAKSAKHHMQIVKVKGPVDQSVVSLTSSLLVKMLTALVRRTPNSQVFFAEKMWVACKSYSHIFSKNIRIYTIFNDQSFNDTLTNDIVSFEQLGPEQLVHPFSTLVAHKVQNPVFLTRKVPDQTARVCRVSSSSW